MTSGMIEINLNSGDPILTDKEIEAIRKCLQHGTENHDREMVEGGALLGRPIPSNLCPSIVIGSLVIGLKIQVQHLLNTAEEFKANEELLNHAKDIINEVKKNDPPPTNEKGSDNAV